MYYDSYGYGAESVMDTTFSFAPLAGMFFGIMIFSFILSLIVIISNWKVFNKAGKPGWASIIPIYNNIVMIEIAKLPMIYLLFIFIPILNIYAIFKINIEIAKKFGKSTGFGIGMTLVSIIFIPMLAFSDNIYEGNETVSENTGTQGFDATNVINNNTATNVVENNIPTEPENVNIEPIEAAPIMQNIETSTIPSEQVVVEKVQNIEPNNTDAIPAENNIPEINETINVAPVFENNIQTEIPVVENNIETTKPEVLETAAPIEKSTLVESLAQNIPNAFNSTPIETVSTETLETVNVEPMQNEIPNTPVVEEIPVSQEMTLNESTPTALEQKKICKSCGAEMPSIVSICPKCGTDNE